MVFSVTTVSLLNMLFIAASIGVFGLCFMQITASVHLRKEARRYFPIFLLLFLI